MVTMPHWPKNIIDKTKINYDLTNIKLVLDYLGNPQNNLPNIIHVAGTNGKGSSCAYLRSIFEQSSYSCHVYTSPHLINFNERIVVNSSFVSDEELFFALECTKKATEFLDVELTFFESTTVAAFLIFAKHKADVLIMETGMGGRLDATNVTDSKLMCLITNIDYDHMEYLGNSLTTIATEKSGIFRPESKIIIAKQQEEAMRALYHLAKKTSSFVKAFEYDYGLEIINNELVYIDTNYSYNFGAPALLGKHQFENAVSAIACAMNLMEEYPNINIDSIALGIKKAYWPARLQKIDTKYYNKVFGAHFELYVDGAHNTGGAKSLAQEIMVLKETKSCKFAKKLGMTKGR
jgi:dihydrofolate synthase/folylpolyglutamate synthase